MLLNHDNENNICKHLNQSVNLDKNQNLHNLRLYWNETLKLVSLLELIFMLIKHKTQGYWPVKTVLITD